MADTVDFEATKRSATKARRSVNFAREMESGDTVETVSVTAADAAGSDVTTSLISGPTASGTRVLWTFLGWGTVGATYYVRVVANTAQGDVLVKVMKLRIVGL